MVYVQNARSAPKWQSSADVSAAQTERRGGAGLVRGLLGTGRFFSSVKITVELAAADSA